MLMKFGRFAWLLPYIILPFVVAIMYQNSIADGFLLTFFMPVGIESPAILFFPFCWLISLVCFILCGISAKKTKKGKIGNIISIIVTALFTVIHVVIVLLFLLNFSISF